MFERFLILSLCYILIDFIYFRGVFVDEEEDVDTAEYLILVMLILFVYTDQVEKADRGIYSN